jgi:two-component system CheB/CheR fusion protein
MADNEKPQRNDSSNDDATDENYGTIVVGVGASAGGYEALEKFFAPMPEDAGAAFVVVQHLSPDYKSLMAELLGKRTKLTPVRIEDGMTVEPNRIYLVPPKKDVALEGDALRVREATYRGGVHLPIDAFFRSLAKARKEKAIAVVLSGAGADGTLGVRDVKGYGGLTVAQDPLDAAFDSMPRSAVATGLIDYVLTPEEMPKRLLAYLRHEPLADDDAERAEPSEASVARAVETLRVKADLDFSLYKPTTVIRRLERRMGVLQCRSVEEYVRKLETSPTEAKTLAKEMLIGVTKFFREPEAFEFLKREIVPKIVETKKTEPVRVWAVGCSTGEEAYSLAIVVAEFLDETHSPLEVKIFATDVDEEAIDRAGVGLYPDTIVSEVSQERLDKFFTREGTNYRVSERIRRMTVFARHNAIVDPPFSRLDLVVCRNLLIYFVPSAQKRALSYFHFALRENGYLFLGKSETVGDMINQFKSVGDELKVYKKLGSEDSVLFGHDVIKSMRRDARRGEAETVSRRGDSRPLRVDRDYRKLMEPFEPSAVLLNERDEPTYVFGEASRFLTIGKGEPDLNVYRMMSDNLAAAARSAVRGARDKGRRVVCEGVPVAEGDRRVNVVASLAYPDVEADRSVLLLFETERRETIDDADEEVIDMDAAAKRRIKDLERELEYAKGNLQATVEELETSNEELQATNEELLASNEELQSSNEEMQSVNEELITVNSEYQKKIDELTRLTSDYDNLLDVADVGTLFLDEKLRVRKFTPRLREALGLRDTDVGRPIDHFSLAFFYEEFLDDLRAAARKGERAEREVETANGVYLITVQPYMDSMGGRDGALVTLADATQRRELFDRIKLLAETLDRSPSVVALTDLRPAITYVNERFTEVTGYALEELRGKNPNALASEKMPADEARKMWRNLVNGKSWETEFRNRRKNGEIYHERATILPLKNKAGEIAHYAKVAEDVTEQVELREKLNDALEKLRLAEAASDGGEKKATGGWARHIGVWEEDFKRRRTEWSASLYRMFGVKRSSFAPSRKSILPLVAKENRKPMERALKAAKKSGEPIDLAFGLAKGKRTLRLKASVSMAGGEPARLEGVVFDVSDEAKRLAKAEKTVAELERRLAALEKK